jgi:hypothetical protein
MMTFVSIAIGVILGLLFTWLAPAALAGLAIVWLSEHMPWLVRIGAPVLFLVIASAHFRRRDS